MASQTRGGIRYLPAGNFLGFSAQVFPHFSEKKEIHGAGYPMVWHLQKKKKQLKVGEEWQVFTSPRKKISIHHLFTSTSLNNC